MSEVVTQIPWEDAEKLFEDSRILEYYSRDRDKYFPELTVEEDGSYQVAIMEETEDGETWTGRLQSGDQLPESYDLEKLTDSLEDEDLEEKGYSRKKIDKKGERSDNR